MDILIQLSSPYAWNVATTGISPARPRRCRCRRHRLVQVEDVEPLPLDARLIRQTGGARARCSAATRWPARSRSGRRGSRPAAGTRLAPARVQRARELAGGSFPMIVRVSMPSPRSASAWSSACSTTAPQKDHEKGTTIPTFIGGTLPRRGAVRPPANGDFSPPALPPARERGPAPWPAAPRAASALLHSGRASASAAASAWGQASQVWPPSVLSVVCRTGRRRAAAESPCSTSSASVPAVRAFDVSLWIDAAEASGPPVSPWRPRLRRARRGPPVPPPSAPRQDAGAPSSPRGAAPDPAR